MFLWKWTLCSSKNWKSIWEQFFLIKKQIPQFSKNNSAVKLISRHGIYLLRRCIVVDNEHGFENTECLLIFAHYRSQPYCQIDGSISCNLTSNICKIEDSGLVIVCKSVEISSKVIVICDEKEMLFAVDVPFFELDWVLIYLMIDVAKLVINPCIMTNDLLYVYYMFTYMFLWEFALSSIEDIGSLCVLTNLTKNLGTKVNYYHYRPIVQINTIY